MAPISAVLLGLALASSFFCMQKTTLFALEWMDIRTQRKPNDVRSLANTVRERLTALYPVSLLWEKATSKKRADEFERGLPEVLRLLCIALESGSSLVMALRYAADNCDEPLSSELKRTVWDIEAGQGFDEAMKKLRRRTGGAEFAYLAVAMEIQHTSGGSLTDILASVSEMLQQSADLKEELQTKTTQGRLSSRIVAIMPFALLVILSVFSPGYLGAFFESAFGIFLLALALLLEIAGVVLVRRSLAIDFSVDIEERA